MSAKPEVELIFTTTPMEYGKYSYDGKCLKNGDRNDVRLKGVR